MLHKFLLSVQVFKLVGFSETGRKLLLEPEWRWQEGEGCVGSCLGHMFFLISDIRFSHHLKNFLQIFYAPLLMHWAQLFIDTVKSIQIYNRTLTPTRAFADKIRLPWSAVYHSNRKSFPVICPCCAPLVQFWMLTQIYPCLWWCSLPFYTTL